MSEQQRVSVNPAYRTLTERFRRASLIGDALGILDWDQATTMPEGSADGRAEQIATLSVMRHELLVDSSVADNLMAAQEAFRDTDPDSWDAANLREMQVAELEMAVEASKAPGYNQAAAPESPTKGLFGCVPGCK